MTLRIERIHWCAVLMWALLMLSPFIGGPAFADIDNPSDAHSTFENFDPFMDRVTVILAGAQASDVGDFVEVLFLFLTTCLVVGALSRYVGNGLTFSDLIEMIVIIAMVRVMMVVYGDLTTALWGWAIGFGGGIQQVALGTDDIFFVGTWLKNVIDRIAIADVSLLDGIILGIAILFLSIILWILSLLAFIGSAWPIYGYAVAKLVGWMFIPTLLVKRLSFLFDGWLRFFFGFLLYAVFIRINLVLIAILWELYFNIPSGTAPGAPIDLPVDNFMDFFGVAALCFISLFGLYSTGRFSVAVAGGVGGFGDMFRSFAMMAGRVGGRK